MLPDPPCPFPGSSRCSSLRSSRSPAAVLLGALALAVSLAAAPGPTAAQGPPGGSNPVVCPVDGQPLAALQPSYLGVIGNATIASTPDIPYLAAELSDAGVKYWRRTVQWLQLEPNPPVGGVPTYDWPRFDSLFLPMAAEGVGPWITLSHTAPWAADLPPGADPADARKYPPRDLQDWRDFVRAVALRYGPGGILATPVRHWDIWQEPDLASFFLGTPADYVDLLNAAYLEIKAADPGATVWAGNTVFAPGRPASVTDPWVNAVFAGGLFDGYAIHPFFQSVADVYASIAAFRTRLTAELGAAVPLAVTATSYQLVPDRCAFADLGPTARAAYVLDTYACGANAGAVHMFWFKTIDRRIQGAECAFDLNGMFTPTRAAGTPWMPNVNLDSVRTVGQYLSPYLPPPQP